MKIDFFVMIMKRLGLLKNLIEIYSNKLCTNIPLEWRLSISMLTPLMLYEVVFFTYQTFKFNNQEQTHHELVCRHLKCFQLVHGLWHSPHQPLHNILKLCKFLWIFWAGTPSKMSWPPLNYLVSESMLRFLVLNLFFQFPCMSLFALFLVYFATITILLL